MKIALLLISLIVLVVLVAFIFWYGKNQPPKEKGPFHQSELIELITMMPTLKLDIRYATPNNFVGCPVYKEGRAFLQRPAAEALIRVNERLHKKGYGLMVFDGYRPWAVTKLFYDIVKPNQRQFVANPKTGSKHNRGCAVDLTLYDLKTGQAVDMPSDFDEMTERAYVNYAGGTAEQRANRDLLRKEMEAEGFTVYDVEWWHFDYKDWKNYPILNIPFSEIHQSMVE